MKSTHSAAVERTKFTSLVFASIGVLLLLGKQCLQNMNVFVRACVSHRPAPEVRFLLDISHTLGVPSVVTEQYPKVCILRYHVLRTIGVRVPV